MDDIRCHFPDWKTDHELRRWPDVKHRLQVGQHVSGNVIAHAPFGIWLDIQESWPALMLIHNLRIAHESPIGIEDFPRLGSVVHGRINALGDRGELGLTQLDPDDTVEGPPANTAT